MGTQSKRDMDEGEGSSNRSGSAYDDGSGQESQTDTNRSGSSDDDIDTLKDSLTKKESKAVFRLRALVILILFAAAASVSVTVFYLTHNAEVSTFETEYVSAAEKITESFQEAMEKIAAVSGLAVTCSANSLNQGLTWPFVTLKNFQELAGNAMALSRAAFVSLNPIVETLELASWEAYVQGDANSWIQDGLEFQEAQGLNDFVDPERAEITWLTHDTVDPLHTFDSASNPILSQASGPFLPRWQTSPVLPFSLVNANLLENSDVSSIAKDSIENKAAVLGGFVTSPAGNTSHIHPTTALFATVLSIEAGKQVDYEGDPLSHLVIPIFDTLRGENRQVVALLMSTIHWVTYMEGILPSSAQGITVVVENACDGFFTYELDGAEASIVGFGDQHQTKFDSYHKEGRFLTETIEDGTLSGVPLNQEGCPYSFHIYPTQRYYHSFITNYPLAISIAVAAVFALTILMFFAYDWLVERRQKLVLAKATRSTAIVSSLFPKQVRDRLLAAENDKTKGEAMLGPHNRLKTYLNGVSAMSQGSHPIADLFPNCTVFFGDIAGFTAWSSTREPAQVFVLLQTVYQSFDVIAKKRRVFKVETIGDSYLAVTGLPEPQPNHAIIMAKFCWECHQRIREITNELEVSLGPDTGELGMRFGLHSGPVTAGVLKGDRARFQLFGDTVNTASRMESTGEAGRIQVSGTTAALLIDAGKSSWLTKREDMVKVKGKGVLTTYWLTHREPQKFKSQSASIASSNDVGASGDIAEESSMPSQRVIDTKPDLKQQRLIDWVSEILLSDIKKVVIVRQRCTKNSMTNEDLIYEPTEGKICLDEVKEAIPMPNFDAKITDAASDYGTVDIPEDVRQSLKEYVSIIAKSYHRNSFHNFEHACHVTMSVHKLLTRIVAPELSTTDMEKLKKGRDEVAAQIHDFTHGITSDPLAVFAITFSALIHDVDHQGISNVQLMKEEPEMAKLYRNKSCAEQNSLDVAWDILMSDQFAMLRKVIFGTKAELMRFRQLIVNIVLATDIFDKELGDLRKSRWERAFDEKSTLAPSVVRNLRATIVMEHIIQASDVSHTMQHWHVYQKWNRNLFGEMYDAWRAGRMGADPREFWYKSELSFFDNYIIPLAKKLKECNVFGVSSDEYLAYAVNNRAEWEERGQSIVESMSAAVDASAQGLASPQLRTPSLETSVDDTLSVQTFSSETEGDGANGTSSIIQ